jgi:hypothetical protein
MMAVPVTSRGHCPPQANSCNVLEITLHKGPLMNILRECCLAW